MRSTSFVAVVALVGTVVPAAAAFRGLPTDRFVQTWTAMPSDQFTSRDRSFDVKIAAVHVGRVPDGSLGDAFASAADPTARRDLAIDEMASALEPARRTALEDLRDAQRRYAAAAGGDADARGIRFAALLRQVIDGSGRSVAKDGVSAGRTLDETYERIIRDAPDAALPVIEASETAWTAYRDAFDRFARAIDRPDAAGSLRDELARHRADELQTEAAR